MFQKFFILFEFGIVKCVLQKNKNKKKIRKEKIKIKFNKILKISIVATSALALSAIVAFPALFFCS